MNAAPPVPPRASRMWSFFWRVVLYLHLVAAAFWWWLMPGGFPFVHPRFWANSIFPWAVAAICVVCLWGERRGRAVLRVATAATIPAFWLGATITAAGLYPYSAQRFLPAAAVVVIIVFLVFFAAFHGGPFRGRQNVIAVVPALGIGCLLVCAQRGGPPATIPADVTVPQFESNVDLRRVTIPIRVSDSVSVRAADGGVLVRHSVPTKPLHGSTEVSPNSTPAVESTNRVYRMDIGPMLSFESRSPDRCWTILAPRRFRESPPRRLISLRHEEEGLTALYRDDTESVLHVTASPNADESKIETVTRLEGPIYSHLNSFVVFTIFGCVNPAISFSPCPETSVGVKPFDYPVGRPIRLAYLDAAGRFHVVTAKRGEKGPFTEFATGSLPNSVPLTITISDDGSAVFRVALDDWAAQADRSLSPTAGWGLPANAIEFSQIGGDDSAAGPVSIWVTLAATSVGRGWDSVGHAAGTYRNRMRIEAISRPIR